MAKRDKKDHSDSDEEDEDVCKAKRHHYSSHYKYEWEKDPVFKDWVSVLLFTERMLAMHIDIVMTGDE